MASWVVRSPLQLLDQSAPGESHEREVAWRPSGGAVLRHAALGRGACRPRGRRFVTPSGSPNWSSWQGSAWAFPAGSLRFRHVRGALLRPASGPRPVGWGRFEVRRRDRLGGRAGRGELSFGAGSAEVVADPHRTAVRAPRATGEQENGEGR
ncbi:hypothetical protein QJS66_03180 [Kocuria rhizophila]|nr:hypothetical protein QJS66_03180 [Kocuria rhizophila]